MIEFVDRRPGNRLAPEGEDAYEILTERIEFNIKSVVPSGAAKELKAPLGKLKPLGSIRTPIWIAYCWVRDFANRAPLFITFMATAPNW